MNAKDYREGSTFPVAMDAAVNKKFRGAKCESRFSIVSMSYVTTWNKNLPRHIKQRIKDFVAGYMAGNKELFERLAAK